ncbi:MAG: HD domain-containing protein [Candidatus Riflebacteria bacterium]|nr:HD domain-containing protein [Candidatus Riflebacteria bacterium]
MKTQYRLELFSLLSCLSDIMDWISPELDNHHKQVAMLAYKIGEELDLSYEDQSEILCAAILHDIGAISLLERIKLSKFEHTNPSKHAEVGFRLLKIFKPLESSAKIVRYHHTPYTESGYDGEEIPFGSRILMVADHISSLIDKNNEILGQTNRITEQICSGYKVSYDPKVTEAYLKLSKTEVFWLDATSPTIDRQLKQVTHMQTLVLDKNHLLSFANFIRRIIDFRSQFTATHSSGVSAVAEEIGRLKGLSDHDCFELKVAGYLHDLGKLAIPKEILEKPDKLTPEEFNFMRAHTFYTYRTLESVEDLAQINKYGSFHHEHLDGNGYPFKINASELSIGSRIMAIADVFTAITEDRPYRKGMKNPMIVLDGMIEHKLDKEIVNLVKDNLEQINEVRISAQQKSIEEYEEFIQKII